MVSSGDGVLTGVAGGAVAVGLSSRGIPGVGVAATASAPLVGVEGACNPPRLAPGPPLTSSTDLGTGARRSASAMP
jgi:hypothetical protein